MRGNECGDLSSIDYTSIWNSPSTKRRKACQLDSASRLRGESSRNGDDDLTLLLDKVLPRVSETQLLLFASPNVGDLRLSRKKRSEHGTHLRKLALLKKVEKNLHVTAENASHRRLLLARPQPSQNANSSALALPGAHRISQSRAKVPANRLEQPVLDLSHLQQSDHQDQHCELKPTVRRRSWNPLSAKSKPTHQPEAKMSIRGPTTTQMQPNDLHRRRTTQRTHRQPLPTMRHHET